MLIIIRGPLGVGKSTIARALAKKLTGIYLSVDATLEELGLDQGENGIPLENFITANEHLFPLIKKTIAAMKPVVIDGNFYHAQQLKHLTKQFDSLVFTLTASLKTCIARDSARKRAYGIDATTAVYNMVNAVKAGTAIDTEKRTPEQTLRTLLEHIKRKQ